MSENESLKPESWLWHLLGLINPIIVMASNIVGGYWVASGVIYMLGLGPILDMLFGRAANRNPLVHLAVPSKPCCIFTHSFSLQHSGHSCIVHPSMAQLGRLGLQH